MNQRRVVHRVPGKLGFARAGPKFGSRDDAGGRLEDQDILPPAARSPRPSTRRRPRAATGRALRARARPMRTGGAREGGATKLVRVLPPTGRACHGTTRARTVAKGRGRRVQYSRGDQDDR